jgi:hypothetical protein
MNTFIEVESSNISGLSYDKEKKEMAVLFTNSGGITIYKGIEIDTFHQVLNAKSIGSYLHRKIYKNYSHMNVQPTSKIFLVDAGKKYITIISDVDFQRKHTIEPCDMCHKIYSGNVYSVLEDELLKCGKCNGTGIEQKNI